jgi:hypothetical protein
MKNHPIKLNQLLNHVIKDMKQQAEPGYLNELTITYANNKPVVVRIYTSKSVKKITNKSR